MSPFKTIMHPTDFSAPAQQALDVARSLARAHGAKLVLVAVPVPPLPAVESFVPEAELQQLAEEARKQLAAMAAGITDVPVEIRVIAGEPGWALVTAAQECHADLIVMGTHGRTGLRRLLMGSVAEHVLRHAPCPVLTIRPSAAS